MQWIEYAKEQPPYTTTGTLMSGMEHGRTDDVLVAYYPEPDTDLHITIAYREYPSPGSSWPNSGWHKTATYDDLPAPRYWMPLPDLPTAR